jgi:transcription initiation factor IIE alpha subunit
MEREESKKKTATYNMTYEQLEQAVREGVQSTLEEAKRKAVNEATEKAFLYMLAIPLNVLVNDYWSKSAKKRAPKFIEEVINLYEAVQAGVVTDDQLAELLWEMAGVRLEGSEDD